MTEVLLAQPSVTDWQSWQRWPTREPTVALTVVARDSEQTIAACLDSCRDAVDEMVVLVDSRSCDRTAQDDREFQAALDWAAPQNLMTWTGCDYLYAWHLRCGRPDLAEAARAKQRELASRECPNDLYPAKPWLGRWALARHEYAVAYMTGETSLPPPLWLMEEPEPVHVA